MESLEGILKLADKELEAVGRNGQFKSKDEIDGVYKLVDIVKDIYCIYEYEDESDDMSYDDGMSYERGGNRSRRSDRYSGNNGGSYRGYSYARGRRNARRDSMGRYSRDDSKEYVEQLHELMEDAPDEKTRQSIKRMIEQMGD